MGIQIAIVGASSIAPSYIRSIGKIDGANVVAVQSRSQQRAATLANRYSIPFATTNLEQLLGRKNIDAVVIASEPSRHIELAYLAIQHEKHVLIEKPLSLDYQVARQFVDTVSDCNSVVSVVSQKRFDPSVLEIKKRIDNELLHPAIVDLQVFQYRDDEYYFSGNGWRCDDSHFFINQGIHWLDILIWCLGEPQSVKPIQCVGRDEIQCSDRAAAIVRWCNGTVGMIAGGSFTPVQMPVTFVIKHNQGVIRYDPVSGVKVRLTNKLSKMWPSGFSRLAGNTLFDHQVTDFVRCIRTGNQPTTTVKQALSALRLALAVDGQLTY